VNIEGNAIYRAGGTDVPVADGGTGASSLTDGGVLLGSGTSAVTAMAVLADSEMIVGDGTTDPVAESGATLRTSIGVGTGNAVEFAGITGTTIDATTDFTIGSMVITDGVITDSSGLQLAANLDIDGTADISGDLTLSAGGDGALRFSAASSIKILDNSAAALVIEEADNAYITFVTTNSSEAITVAKATTFTSTVTVGSDGSGTDVIFYSGTGGDNFTWDASEEKLIITGTVGQFGLEVAAGHVLIKDVLFFEDQGGEYISSDGSTLTIAGNIVFSSATVEVSGILYIRDDNEIYLGTDSDSLISHRDDAIGADVEIGDTIVGTSVHPGTAANSLIVSNTTTDGDILFLVSDGGNSKGLLKLNGADGTVELHGNLLPTTDDTYDLGSASAAWQDLFLEGNITMSDAGTIATTAGDITLNSGGGGVVVNPTVSTTSGITQFQVRGDITTTDGTSNQRYIGAGGGFGGSVVINSGNTHGKVATVELYEPNITETSGSVTVASTLYIGDAPTEANSSGINFNSYAIFVDSGMSRFESHVAGTQTLDIHNTGNAGSNYLVMFADDGAQVGSIVHDDGGTTTYNTSSDYRLKENAVTLSGAVTRVKNLKPYRFNFITSPSTTKDGFFAHEVQTVVPEAVSGTKDAVHADNSIFPQGMDNSKLVPLLTAAIQELDARVAALES
jgi:hypothetical protein